MKRVITFAIFLTILYFIFQYGVVFFKTEHVEEYSLKIEDKIYVINESYSKNKVDDFYLLTITVDNKEFVFDIDNSFNKQKNIVKDVKVYEADDLLCIYPIFLNDKVTGELECNIEGKLYSYFSIRDTYNLESFVDTLPGYEKGFVGGTKTESYADLEVYIDNIMPDEHIVLYNYKSIFNITNKGNNHYNFSIKDVYTNKNGILVDKYYLVPDGNVAGIHEYMAVMDVETGSTFELPLRNQLSSNYYINGVVDNVLYIFDKSNLVQYSINPDHRDIRIECTKDSMCNAYLDGKWVTVSAYDMLNKEIKFGEDYGFLEDKIDVVTKSKRYYYYKTGNAFYRAYVNAPEKKVQLFTNSDISIVRIANGSIYYIENDVLYRYTTNSIVPLMKRNEFKFNYYNIFDVHWGNDDKK